MLIYNNLKKALLLTLVMLLISSNAEGLAQQNDVAEYKYLESAKTLLIQKRYNEAETVFKKVLKINPSNIHCILELARLYIQWNQLEKAQKYLNIAIGLNPQNSTIYSLKAEIFYKNNEWDKAKFAAEKAISLYKKDSQAYLILGHIFLKNNQTKESFQNYYLSYKYNPALPDAYIGMSKIYLADDNLDKAYDELLKAQELDITNSDTLFYLGEFNFKIGEYEKAIRYLEKSTFNLANSDYRPHFLLAIIYEKLGDLNKARIEYLKTTRINPDHKEAQDRLKQLEPAFQQISNQVPTDIVDFKDSLDQSYSDLSAIIKADYFLLFDRFSEAKDLYLQVLKNNPYNIAAKIGICEIYYAQSFTNYLDRKQYYLDTELLQGFQSDNLKIPLVKFKLAVSDNIPDSIKAELQKNTNENHLFNSIRANFLLGYITAGSKTVHQFLNSNPANSEKYKLAKLLFFDRNYYESQNLFETLKGTEYEQVSNSALSRINVKVNLSDRRYQRGINLYIEKNYYAAYTEFSEAIKLFPFHKESHLYLALVLEKVGQIENAKSTLEKYIELEEIYPSQKPVLVIKKARRLLEEWKKININDKTIRT